MFYSAIQDGKNPIISALDIDDYPNPQFVADPFLLRDDSRWHLFFEIKGPGTPGAIGHAVSADFGSSWEYNQLILKEDVHLSFPYVFEDSGRFYLLPEVGGTSGREIVLYESTDFPRGWDQVGVLLETNNTIGDPVLFKSGEYWWLIYGHQDTDTMAYFNEELATDGWEPHENNPIRAHQDGITRPGGRPLKVNGQLYLFLQDCREAYGHYLRAFRVDELTPSKYADTEVPLNSFLNPQSGLLNWRGGRMHHIDCQNINGKYICITDGDTDLKSLFGSRWSIGMFEFDDLIIDEI